VISSVLAKHGLGIVPSFLLRPTNSWIDGIVNILVSIAGWGKGRGSEEKSKDTPAPGFLKRPL
jgi:hypothetical protein